MGAKNHQPTNTILTGVSAWLSQRLGMGLIEVQRANNHLEDAIILGMNKKYVEDFARDLSGSCADHLSSALEALENSKKHVLETQAGFDRILEAAEKEGYTGNPLASKVEEYQLDKLFSDAFIATTINETIWHRVLGRIKTENILATLRWEQEQFGKLPTLTDDFAQTLRMCLSCAKKDGGEAMVYAVENNQIPVRQYGFRLFSAWSDADLAFTYSALIMTELYYRANGFPSLAEFDPIHDKANIA
jgi:hypothetical protein